jgi:hypothetical protein
MFVTRISRYIYSVRFYPWFHTTMVGLGTYHLWIRGTTVLTVPCLYIYALMLLAVKNQTI